MRNEDKGKLAMIAIKLIRRGFDCSPEEFYPYVDGIIGMLTEIIKEEEDECIKCDDYK